MSGTTGGWRGYARVAVDYRYALRNLAVSRVRRERIADGDGADVVLLSGIWEPRGYLHPLAAALRARGFRTHALSQLSLNRPPVDVLAARAAAWMDEQGLGDAVIVGHSKGGLVGKRLLIDGYGSGLVAVCTPFGGSTLAAVPPEFLGSRGLLPGSPMLAALDEHTDVNERIVALYPPADATVPGGGALAGARNIQVGRRGHFGVLSDPEMQDAVVEAIGWLSRRP